MVKVEDKEGAENGGKVKGVFVNVRVESHLHSSPPSALDVASTSAQSSAPPSTSAPEDAAAAVKLSTWKLLPSKAGAAAALRHLHVTNAPPIPVTPLGPFTLPGLFEMFQPK